MKYLNALVGLVVILVGCAVMYVALAVDESSALHSYSVLLGVSAGMNIALGLRLASSTLKGTAGLQ